MAADDLIPVEGVITHVHKGIFTVETEHGTTVQAHLGGKLRKFRIKVVLGDQVRVEISPYDLKRGRIVFRHK